MIGVCCDWVGLGSKFFVELSTVSLKTVTGGTSSVVSMKKLLCEKLRLLIVHDVVPCRKIHTKMRLHIIAQRHLKPVMGWRQWDGGTLKKTVGFTVLSWTMSC